MSYSLTLSNGNILTSVPDTQIVTSYGGLSLIGKNFAGFGTSFNNDLIHITENFASATPPANPFIGQIWYDSVGETINFWDGSQFKSISVITSSDSAPISPQIGDEWYNTTTQQLFIWTGTQWLLIGPPGAQGGKEGFVVAQASNGTYYLQLYANNEIIAIVSSIEMINPGIPGVGNVRPGFNFITNPESTPPITSAGMFNLTELTIGDGDQILLNADENNISQFIVNGNIAFLTTSDPISVGTSLIAAQELISGNVKGSFFANVISANHYVGIPTLVVPGTNGQFLYSTGTGENGWAATSELTINGSGITASALTVQAGVSIGSSLTVGAGLIVTQTATFDSAVNIGSSLTVSADTTMQGSAHIGQNLNVDGIIHASASINTTGSVAAGGALSGLSLSITGDGATIGGATTINGTTTINGSENVNGSLTVTGAVNLENNLSVTDNTTIGGSTQVNQNLTVNGTSTLEGSVSLGGQTTVNAGGGSSYILPGNRGVAGAALVTNADGSTQWGIPSSAGGVSGGTVGQHLISNGANFVPRSLVLSGNLAGIGGRTNNGPLIQNNTGAEMIVSGCIQCQGSGTGTVHGVVSPDGFTNINVWNLFIGATVDNGEAGFYFTVPAGYWYRAFGDGNVNRGMLTFYEYTWV